MRLLLYIFLICISAVSLKAQSRDTVVTRTLYYVTADSKTVLDSSVIWSNNLNDYLLYSRLEMGNRMNQGIYYQRKSHKNFMYGNTCLALSTASFIVCAHMNPVVYIDNHNKYNRNYFNRAKRERNQMIAVGSILAGSAVYFYWRSYKHSKKSRWSISPDGIKYKIGSP